jgi:hypothetical protein
MDNNSFLERLLMWEKIPANDEHCAERYDILCTLYLEATPEQRAQLPLLVVPDHDVTFYHDLHEWISVRRASDDRIAELHSYMRELPSRIKSPADTRFLRLGLAAAAMIEECIDYRDVIVSLAFLHLAATEAEIDPAPQFMEIAKMARPETGRFLRDFLKRSTDDIKDMVEAFS